MGIFSKIFGKKEVVLEPADFSILGTDVHSHFIPGIDDGAATMDDSLELIGSMQALGYKKVITTPHVMSDYYQNTPEIILSGLKDVRAAMKTAGMTIELEAAAEYYLDEQLVEKVKSGNVLTFGNNYLLYELAFINDPGSLMATTVFEMQTAGYKPILAHVERYPFWFNNLEKYQELYDKGIILQVNIGSITGAYGPEVKKAAELLIDNDLVGLISSDCHHLRHIDMLKKAATMPYFHKVIERDLLNKKL